ncbi:FUSC family protein [Halarcobacter anaerophilus]|uniref:Fusaric acid resistance protein n=1 Tax=Halarcobacter anaerophilus TaxID=877500 RepID=A0A4V1LPI4_9BACT|nr:FUSC family protein [Halarcobacter anaerophilus]QDF28465.1 putative fusaric acid resistance efflux pump, inner membrane transporter [Halarcobacter anaerophilus]RXJ61308.1 hypothetical protein CRV06_14150 [Halarcobacter anaerophilus]
MLAITKENFKLAANEWTSKDLPGFIYVLKSVTASLLALCLCMVFNLQMPQTSVFTLFIVMQPFSGLVFSKSFYRLIGTVLGTIMAIALLGAFAQDRVSFTIFFALWVGLCSAVGFMARNFMTYGFVLSGYTIALVTMPIMETPSEVFNFGIDRLSEVLIGLLSASFVSEVLFPQNLSKSLIKSEKNKFKLILENLLNKQSLFNFETPTINYSRDILGSDSLRVNSSFETNLKKVDKIYYKRLNFEFMHICTTFFSLRNIINNSKDDKVFLESLKKIYDDFEVALKEFQEKPIEAKNINSLLFKLKEVKVKSKNIIEEEKQRLQLNSFESQNDFRSITHLIKRLENELYEYCNTYYNFISKNKKIKISQNFTQNLKFSTYSDNVLIFTMITRATFALIVMMSLWMITGWHYAVFAVIPAVANTLLVSTAPNPYGITKNMIIGTVLGLIITPIYNFYLIPAYVNDLFTLCLVLTPALAFISLLMILPGKGLMGFGILLIFINTCAIYTHYNMTFEFFADISIATIIGMLISAYSFVLMDFASNAWIESRVKKVLSKQISVLTQDDLALQRTKLEMLNFDLMQRYSMVGRLDNKTNSKIFIWILSTLEIGKSIINIRKKQTMFTQRKPVQIRIILNYLVKLFNEKDKTDKDKIVVKFKKLMNDLGNKHLKSANDQVLLKEIYLELSIIYSIIKNRKFLPLNEEN